MASMQEAGGMSSPGRLWWRFVDGKFPLEFGEAMDRIEFTKAVVHIDLYYLDTTIGKADEYAAPGGLQRPTCIIVSSSCQGRSGRWL